MIICYHIIKVMYYDLSQAIRNRIDHLRKRDNISVYGLSIKAGIPQTTLINIMEGNTKYPSIKNLVLIATAFNLNIVDFLNTDDILTSIPD